MSVLQSPPPMSPPDPDEIEIRLNDIVDFIRDSRGRILLGALIGLILGFLYAFSKPNMYTAQVTVMPEIQSKGTTGLGGLGQLGSLAGLAGINLDNISSTDAIRPDLYPTVLQSVPFALTLLKQPVYSPVLNAKLTLQEFTERMNNEGPTGWINNIFENNRRKPGGQSDPTNFSQAIQVTKEQDELIKIVQASTSADYDKKTGIITITANEPDPVVAATVTRLSLEYLTNYITTYRTEKSRQQVSFLHQQVAEAKSRYQSAEYTLSAYRDRNRSLFLQTAKIEEQRLQSDYLLAQSVYNELSKQLEQAKIKVQEETPVFKTLEPPTVPLFKSGPKRTVLMIGSAIAGAFIVMAWLLARRVLTNKPAQTA